VYEAIAAAVKCRCRLNLVTAETVHVADFWFLLQLAINSLLAIAIPA
jgi:hypothetical protein